MEWEEQYYNGTRNESRVARIPTNTVVSDRLIVSTLIVASEGYKRRFTCKTKFKASGLSTSTTATNIPNYEFKCVVSVSAFQKATTTGRLLVSIEIS